jgi:hypothetical protein
MITHSPVIRSIFANSRRVALVAIVTTLIAVSLTLAVMGRNWLCTCGEFRLWVGDIWSSENSQQLSDPYTFAHFSKGLLFFWLMTALFKRASMLWRLWGAVLIESAWEILENSPPVIDRFRAVTISLGYSGDTVLNALGDIGAMALGFYVATKLGFRRTLILFTIIEVALAVIVRDNLTLTVIMLLSPVDAIREWQMAGR